MKHLVSYLILVGAPLDILGAPRILQLPAPLSHTIDRTTHIANIQDISPLLVLHFTREKLDKTLQIFLGYTKSTAAPHYTISEQGIIFQHIPEDRGGRHAGASFWRTICGQDAINTHSIGIEHVNDGYKISPEQQSGVVVQGSAHEWYPYTAKQIAASIELCTSLVKKYGIEPRNVVGHSDIAPRRRIDPGPLFPWHTFAQAGIGAWPRTHSHAPLACLHHAYKKDCVKEWLITHLHIWGYRTPSEHCTAQDIIQAFQMHFRPTDISGNPDEETVTILHTLLCEHLLPVHRTCPCYLPPFLQDPSSWAQETLQTMTLREKIGQLFMVASSSSTSNEQPTESLASAFLHSPYNMSQEHVEACITQHHVGGIIFLYKSSPEKQIACVNRYQTLSKVPLLIAQDAEWGLSMRLEKTPVFPHARILGTMSDDLVYRVGREIGRHCRAVGVHMNLAPVVDVDSNPLNPVIGSRSFGAEPHIVSCKGWAFAHGLGDAQVLACAKHFPGHGDTTVDSHFALPLVPYTRKELEARELIPFKYMIAHGIPAVMIAHLQVPAYDPQQSSIASLSPALTTTLLQVELGFKGLVITDGLGMKSVTNQYAPGEIELRAFLAGNDIILGPLAVDKAIDLIEQQIQSGLVSEKELDRRVLKILQAKAWLHLHQERFVNETPVLVTQETLNLQQQCLSK